MSYSKRQELLDVTCFENNFDFESPTQIVRPKFPDDKLRYVISNVIYIGDLVPTRIIENHEVFKIIKIDPVLIMNGFIIKLENLMVKQVHILGIHPNCDTDTDVFCLPDDKLNVKFDEGYFIMLLQTLKTYYLDSFYFRPLNNMIRYEKLQSIYISKE